MCGTRVSLDPALCGNRLLDAIMLQADRLGVEITCQNCHEIFIYSRLESLARLRRHAQVNGGSIPDRHEDDDVDHPLVAEDRSLDETRVTPRPEKVLVPA
jgi:hypothetical protein